MIRNIIFDLGNVLISFRPAEYLKNKNYPEDLLSIILTDIFRSREWLLMDNGDLTREEAVEMISKKSILKKEEISRIFDLRTEIMFPITGNVKILPELKKQGFRLYYLSNFPGDIFDEIKNRNSFFCHFDGGIISADVNHSKPDHEIFRILLRKYNLDPSESLYLDDIEDNVKSARELGLTGYFTEGSSDIGTVIFNMLKKTSSYDNQK